MGLGRQDLGTYAWGFVAFAVVALLVLVLLRAMQAGWTRSWAGHGGRARTHAAGAAAWAGGSPHPQPLSHASQE